MRRIIRIGDYNHTIKQKLFDLKLLLIDFGYIKLYNKAIQFPKAENINVYPRIQ